MTQQQSPVWFITGCSTGFGKELAKLVLARGWRAVVTARNPDRLTGLVSGHKENALALQLNVTDRAQIAQAVRQAEERFGRIDVLVNNAGYGYLAAVEEGEDDQIRAMFETNFFGLVALTNAVLPGMRKRRSGHIVNFSFLDRRFGQLCRYRLLSRHKIRSGRPVGIAFDRSRSSGHQGTDRRTGPVPHGLGRTLAA